jgi:hypothetical protein
MITFIDRCIGKLVRSSIGWLTGRSVSLFTEANFFPNFGSSSRYHFCPNGIVIIVTPTVSLTSTKVSGKEKYKSTCIKEMKKFPASLQEMKETN